MALVSKFPFLASKFFIRKLTSLQTARETGVNSCPSRVKFFFFARVSLYPLCCQVLHHVCISMIVSRFTSLIEDFDRLLSSHRIFPLEALLPSSSSARSPCDFGSLADFTILVFWEVSMNTVLP